MARVRIKENELVRQLVSRIYIVYNPQLFGSFRFNVEDSVDTEYAHSGLAVRSREKFEIHISDVLRLGLRTGKGWST